MSDRAEVIREFIAHGDCDCEPSDETVAMGIAAYRALDALVAERDEQRQSFKLWFARYKEEHGRAEAAEAERDSARGFCLAADADAKAAEARVAELEEAAKDNNSAHRHCISRRHAAEARVAELEKALRPFTLNTVRDVSGFGALGEHIIVARAALAREDTDE